MDTQWDAVIVGGGSAGLTAGIVLARAQFTTLVIDGGEARNAPAAHMHGYLSRDGMAPAELLRTGKAEFTGYGGTLTHATVTGAARRADGSTSLTLAQGRELQARAVLVATGLADELPEVPGLRERWAVDVHHCPHCHGYEVRGTSIAVIGGPMVEMSVHLAALLRRYSPTVTFCLNGIELNGTERDRLTAYGVRLVDGEVHRVVAEHGTLTGIELGHGETVPCDTVFVAPRPRPHDALLTALGCRKDPLTGLIAVDERGATDVPGVWAAGNVVNPRAQVVTAASAGCVAAIAITGWLLEQDLAAAGNRSADIGGARR
ncbi:NAD(P)/FAD-dependent oxidoreductase [Actinophytocola algeriensis]|uniref:Thioredoxin reductase (NADPH) n=1 Tax=Actinophytocola algeriensis TaxID=1768010 RepID=A0A7W7Q820_9PSEU|nr:NAD(P)/FAD-dependent oxidoreductase [Actinophytocola algeriensis]MBB4908792.1 thioredoxin reductase (NADPH) [Actinophytocola algeriensis]MBE1474821.1 thioredoxin reductase (NADPH) [Actinophytocola algeriensis]